MIPEPIMAFFSMPDTVLILVIALLLFGPKNLPKMARSIGKSMEEFRRAAREIETEIMKEPEPTTPPPPPPPSAIEGAPAAEHTPEGEHHYGETGEEYNGYDSETNVGTPDSAPVVVADAPVVLHETATPAVATPAPSPVEPGPAAAAAVAAAVPTVVTPAPESTAIPVAVPAPAAPVVPANPPTEKKTDVTPAA